MNNYKFRLRYLKILLIFFIILVPWTIADYFDTLSPDVPRQEDVAFYEINPCRVSLFEFLIKNPNSIYQDHYYFRYDNSSSIKCFGKITGLSIVNNDFYISIGTNSLVNLFLQGSFWYFLFSLINKKNPNLEIKKQFHLISVLVVSYYFCFSIYAESRFYDDNLYNFDLDIFRSRLFLFFLIFLIFKNIIELFNYKFYDMINYLPFSYLIITVFSGFNITYYTLIFIYYGVLSILKKEYNKKLNIIMVMFSIFWIFNSSNRFYLDPDKLRGFTSSIYEFNASISWTFMFIFIIHGLLYFFKANLKYFDLKRISQNFSIVSILLIFLGYLGANFPIINFLNYYYFGQQKFGVKIQNPFIFNEWGEKIAWRGFYPSAESAGEFFGIVILLILFRYFKNHKISYLDIIGFFVSLTGLYFSNNRSVMVILGIAILVLLYKKYSFIKLKNASLLSISIVAIFIIIFAIGIQNLDYSYSYASSIMFEQMDNYQINKVESSYSKYLIESVKKQGIIYYIFGFIGYLAFLINRAEIWGIFFARYNPTYFELIFGTGPFNFGQLYGEVKVDQTRSFLLPHSSALSFLVFIGILGLIILAIFLIIKIITSKSKITTEGYIFIVFIFLNVIKNDVLNYFSSFSLYFFLIYLILNKDNRRVFQSKLKI